MKTKLALIFLSLLGLALSIHFLRTGLPTADDGLLMVLRSTGFHKSIKDGHFPVRWITQLNEGYGYPVTNFLYPLPFYLAEIPIFLGATPLASIKFLFVFSVVVSGLTMFAWLRHRNSIPVATLGSVAYLTFPYRLLDLYDRGSLGENLSFALLPLTFLFIDKFASTKRVHHLLIAALFTAGLIMTHNTIAFLSLPLILVYLIFTLRFTKTNFFYSCLFLTTTLGLSAFFWLPALWDLQFTRAGQTSLSNPADYFSSLKHLLILTSPLAFFALLTPLITKKSKSIHLFVVAIIASLFFQLPLSIPLWSLLNFDHLIQFPFRFQTIIVLLTPFLITYLLTHAKSKLLKLILVILVLGNATNSFIRLNQISSQPVDQSFFDTNFHTSTTQAEFTPKWVKVDPETVATQPFLIQANPDVYTVTESQEKTGEIYLQLSLLEKVRLTFNRHYFPGWHIYVDDVPTEFQVNDRGLPYLEITSPERRGKNRNIKLVWQETPMRQSANLISLISLVAIISFLTHAFHQGHPQKSIHTLSLILLLTSLTVATIPHLSEFQTVFDPEYMRSRYLDSQWVNPDSNHPLGDHGLYSWAGWAYIHGENPILINSEVPPLGKYLIGIGLLLTGRAAIVGLTFSFLLLVSLYFLSRHIISDSRLSLLPVALFATESIFTGSLVFTMLDNLQVAFAALAFLFLLKAHTNPRWFTAATLSIGGVISTKFFALGILFIGSIILFYFLTRRFRQLWLFILFLPLAALVHISSYTKFFFLGNSFRDYLGVQKYIWNFYRQGSPSVPFGSYWSLVLLNRWQVWWGENWGESYTISADQWQPTWPINFFAGLTAIFTFLKQTALLWRRRFTKVPSYHLLTSWLLVYGLFLTTIGGWPHYMILFLPFSNILLIKLLSDHHQLLITKLKPFLKPLRQRLVRFVS